MNSLLRLAPIVCALSFAHAADLKPETAAAFDHYVKLTEEGIDKRTGSDFLLLETNAKQKTLVWLGQNVIEPKKTLDQGREIDIPDGLLQDWIADIFLERETVDRVRDFLLTLPITRIISSSRLSNPSWSNAMETTSMPFSV